MTQLLSTILTQLTIVRAQVKDMIIATVMTSVRFLMIRLCSHLMVVIQLLKNARLAQYLLSLIVISNLLCGTDC